MTYHPFEIEGPVKVGSVTRACVQKTVGGPAEACRKQQLAKLRLASKQEDTQGCSDRSANGYEGKAMGELAVVVQEEQRIRWRPDEHIGIG